MLIQVSEEKNKKRCHFTRINQLTGDLMQCDILTNRKADEQGRIYCDFDFAVVNKINKKRQQEKNDILKLKIIRFIDNNKYIVDDKWIVPCSDLLDLLKTNYFEKQKYPDIPE